MTSPPLRMLPQYSKVVKGKRVMCNLIFRITMIKHCLFCHISYLAVRDDNTPVSPPPLLATFETCRNCSIPMAPLSTKIDRGPILIVEFWLQTLSCLLLMQGFAMGLLPDTYTCGLRLRRECREQLLRHRFQRKPLVSNPDMHHGTCVTHVPWCTSGSLTCGGVENVLGIPGACATRKST